MVAVKRALAAVAVAITLLSLAWLLRREFVAPAPTQRLTLYVFGSLSEIQLAHPDAARAQQALAALERRLNARHREWHPWEPGDLDELNRALARGEAHTTTGSIARLIRVSQPLVDASQGLFDPGIGGLIALWGFYTSDYPILTPAPDAAAIAQWRAQAPSLNQVQLRERVVSSSNRAVRLDFNAIAEGAAALEAAQILREHGLGDALISLGGDLYALGAHAERPWRVALRSPEGGVLATAALHDGEALFSSGAYNRYRVARGQRLPHLLDPRTGEPARDTLAAAALSRDPLRADVAATSLMIAGPSQWLAVANRLGVRCALIVASDGSIWITPAMQARLTLVDASRAVHSAGEAGRCD